MIEKGKRGGMCQVSVSHIIANNPYMGGDYKEYLEHVFIMYLDRTIYMGLQWSRTYLTMGINGCVEQTVEDIKNYNPTTSPVGYFFEVDLEYPKELHDLHKDYPMAPELEAVKANQLSEFMKRNYLNYYCKEFKDETGEKLLLTLNDKKEYVYHVSVLNMY